MGGSVRGRGKKDHFPATEKFQSQNRQRKQEREIYKEEE